MSASVRFFARKILPLFADIEVHGDKHAAKCEDRDEGETKKLHDAILAPETDKRTSAFSYEVCHWGLNRDLTNYEN